MKLVITIDDDIYEDYLKQGATILKYGTAINSLYKALWNGVPLPEHHGRLIDEKDLSLLTVHLIDGMLVCDAPTIIEGSESE